MGKNVKFRIYFISIPNNGFTELDDVGGEGKGGLKISLKNVT